MGFGPGVETQFSHRSGKSTERVKIAKLHQLHSFVFRVQFDCFSCSLSIQIKERTGKTSNIFSESSHFLILLSAYLLEIK